MRSRVLALVIALSTIVSTPLLSHPLGCPPGARPLIKLLDYFATSTVVMPNPSESRGAVLVCDQGTVLAASLSGPSGSKLPEKAIIERGTASKAAMDELQAAMRNARIGFHRDCRFFGPRGVTVGARIKWFGAGRRVNSFVLSPEVVPLPPCGPLTLLLFDALDSVVGSASLAADRERVDIL